MNDIFGIPMSGIMAVLVVTLIICLLSVLWVAWRRPVIFKLGTRNIPRRKAQSALIILGLMLSTLIIAAALGTGDTVNNSVTSEVYDTLGPVDELVIASQDVEARTDMTSQGSLGPEALALVEGAVADAPADGVLPLLEDRVPVQHDAQNLAEPDVILVGVDPERLASFGGLNGTNGRPLDMSQLSASDVILSQKLAGELRASAGDQITIFIDDLPHQVNVAAIAQDSYLSGVRRSNGTGLQHPGLAMTLAGMQEMTGRAGEYSAIAVSNSGDAHDGLDHSEEVTETLRGAIAGTGLGVDDIKEYRVDAAETLGTGFSTIFVLLGLFSVMSGVLLIILIFTMLASERRSEMGMERAIGTHRSQLIQQFIAEGSGYALFAGLAGVGLGVLAVYGIAQGIGAIFGEYATVEAHIDMRSIIVAYCLGTVITFLTVVIASWKISRVNIVAAVRDIPDIVIARRRKRTLLWASLLTLVGAFAVFAGSGGSSAPLFTIGMSLLPFGIALFLRFAGVPSRPVFTLVGIYLLVFWMLPESTFTRLFGDYEFGLEMFFISGIFMVVAATLVIVQNADLMLAAISRFGTLFRSRLPAVRTGVAYPGAARGRTGLTVAMFSLIVFSLVMMATMNQNYTESALGDESNAGWDVRADTHSTNPPADLAGTLDANGFDTNRISAIGTVTNPSEYASQVRLAGTDEWKLWPVFGADQQFIEESRLKFGQRATGYETDADVIQALLTEPNVAVIDTGVLPSEGNIGNNDDALELEGLKSSDEVFEPVALQLQNPTGGEPYSVTIIGIIDSQIGSLYGMFANQQTIDAVYPSHTATSWYVRLANSSDADAAAKDIESALLHGGVQGTSIRDELKELQKQESGFLYIIEGFMGLGLFVGVAAVGVIAFRSVVERRQQIGVLRAIGFSRELVSLSFMVETLFVVGLGVLTGVALGLGLAQRLVTDPDQGFSSEIDFVIPWTIILVVAGATILVALLMTWIPSRQAGKIAPAEALRYE